MLKIIGLIALLTSFTGLAWAVRIDNLPSNKISNLVLNGTSVLQLTFSPGCPLLGCNSESSMDYLNTGYGQKGSTFYGKKLNVSAFTTNFKFRINGTGNGWNPDNTTTGGDGFAFVLQPASSSALSVGAGPSLGYGGRWGWNVVANQAIWIDDGIPHSVAIEFDTYHNVSYNDLLRNHVAVDINGDTRHSLNGPLSPVEIPEDINNGAIYYVWMDYDGKTLEVRLSNTNIRPIDALLTRAINIPKIIGSNKAFAGFTASTGGYWENQDILSWDYTSDIDQ